MRTMRRLLFATAVLSFVPVFLYAGTQPAKSPATALSAFTADATAAVCGNIRKDTKTCGLKLTGATRNATGQNSAIWAFTATVLAPLSVKGDPRDHMRISLEPLTIQVMEPVNEGFTVVAYYREDAGSFTRVTTNTFAAAALNPVDKVVARYDAGFLEKNQLRYTLPQVWSTAGVSPGAEYEAALTLELLKSETISVQLNDLDDSQLKDLTITACSLVSAGNSANACDADSVSLPAGKSSLSLKVAARRKIKSSQPAFKVAIRQTSNNQPILQLAVPFKPQPNYFLFGITGFLFGGLIAVMILFLKKNPKQKLNI